MLADFAFHSRPATTARAWTRNSHGDPDAGLAGCRGPLVNPIFCRNRRTVINVIFTAALRADTGVVAGMGDNVVAGEIVDLQPRLHRFARSLTRDPEEAADLAQETTVRALGALRSFTPGTNLRAWLFRILCNVYLNRRRVARRHPAPATPAVSLPGLDPTGNGLHSVEHHVLVRAELRAVLEAFRQLPERYATPLYLTAVEEKSYAEVASELEVPIGTVMSRIYRARQMLLARLAEGWP